jgi:cytoskeletal protein CcmA (bactofilin family)
MEETDMIKHGIKALVALMAIMLVVFFAASPALAADVRNEDSVVIASGDVINDDLYLAGSRIIINGTVNGDVMAAGDTITVNGKIDGSIIAVGSTIGIDGEVTHAARVAGGDINIDGTIGGDLAVAGSSVKIDGSAEIGQDVIFAASRISINGPVGGDVKGGGGRVILQNVVEGNVELGIEPLEIYTMVDIKSDIDFRVDRLTVEPTAHIKGDLTYLSKEEANIMPGANIDGEITHRIPEVREPIIPPTLGIWSKVIAFLMMLLVGIVIILIAPKRSLALAASIKRKPLLSLGWGAVILLATPIAALIIFITVIGIPVSLLGMVLYGIAIFLSQIVVGLFIGYWILGSFSRVESRGMLIGALALGFAILTLIKLIPYLGIPLWIATVLFGMGAMALSQQTLNKMAAGNGTEVPE